ncbi:Cytochrome c-type biogenesis protein CcmE, heme chaperone [hydrothermal vent metagenome]|uniref:Cytochrome c-type biogenesis protein CcmE, heme chaperone n=1 Tax=hydrothermal vent metagenome TaxID=652676 RepID=A0A3B1AI93_9ZZZZ
MTPVRKRRLSMVALLVLGVAAATAFALQALNENINLFYTATQVYAGEAPQGRSIRLGGMVVEGSVKRSSQGNDLTVNFDLTDNEQTVTVAYSGILPDLFREGQGIIATGKVNEGGMFVADEVLAKHDEEYMPPEVAATMKKAKLNMEKKQNSKQQGGSY